MRIHDYKQEEEKEEKTHLIVFSWLLGDYQCSFRLFPCTDIIDIEIQTTWVIAFD